MAVDDRIGKHNRIMYSVGIAINQWLIKWNIACGIAQQNTGT